MSWQDKIKNYRHFSKVKYFLALPVFLLLLFLLMRWTPNNSSFTLKYLPANTSFYWQWSSRDFLDNKILEALHIIKAEELDQQEQFLSSLLGDAWPQVEELIWFKIQNDETDYYLLRFDNAKTVSKNLSVIKPEFSYQLLAKDILAVYGKEKEALVPATEALVTEASIDEGINIYWQTNSAPEFLADLSTWLQLAPENPSVYANLKILKNNKLSFNVWQNKLRRLINASSTYAWPNQVLVPYDTNLAIGFSSILEEEEQSLISQYFLNNLFPDLPYYNISQEELSRLIFRGSFILKNQDAWLLLSLIDWQTVAAKLVPDFKLKEVKKLLPDKTSYTAYEMEETATEQMHSYRGQEYWQIGNLYGWGNNEAYYLSNQASMIEKSIASQVRLIDLVKSCSASNLQINDLLLLNTADLADSALKELLSARGLSNLTIFSYQDEEKLGWQACF